MKLSTTTLGCLDWDLPTILERLKAYGYDGVDFRGYRQELMIWKHPAFSTDIDRSAVLIRDAGLQVSCISSGIHLTHTEPEAVAARIEELERTAEICAALDCRMIRVFGGRFKEDEMDREDAIKIAAESATQLIERARRIAPVDILIETHDAWTSSKDLKALLTRIGHDNVACLWDTKHTYWSAAEAPSLTWKELRQWIRNTHWKDALRHPADGALVPTGDGVVPLAEAYDLMRAAGYDGWYTLEWEKQWHPEIAEPEVAFPRFVAFMRALEAL